MSAVLKAPIAKPLATAARDYLAARAAMQAASYKLMRANQALADAEETFLISFDNGANEDVSAVFVDGTVLSVREEHWDLKPGDRIAVLRAEAA